MAQNPTLITHKRTPTSITQALEWMFPFMERKLWIRAQSDLKDLAVTADSMRRMANVEYAEIIKQSARFNRHYYVDDRYGTDLYKLLYESRHVLNLQKVWSKFYILIESHKYMQTHKTRLFNRPLPEIPRSPVSLYTIHSPLRKLDILSARNGYSSEPDTIARVSPSNYMVGHVTTAATVYDGGMANDSKLKEIQKENAKLKKDNAAMKTRIEELTMRLNSVGSGNTGNTNTSDVVDSQTPSKIGERFTQVFNNEWAKAFSVARKVLLTEEEVYTALAELVQSCYDFAKVKSTSQQKQMEKDLLTNVKLTFIGGDQGTSEIDKKLLMLCSKHTLDFRKATVDISAKEVCKMFNDQKMQTLPLYLDLEEKADTDVMDSYGDTVVTLCWSMCIQDPPMDLFFAAPNQPFNSTEFMEYSKTGTTSKICVWPSVHLHKDGPLVSKGLVLPL